jgi:hypothetical protein
LLRIIQYLAEVPRHLDLTPEEQKSQPLEAGIERDDASRFNADCGIDIARNLEQQSRESLTIEARIDPGGREQPVKRSGGRHLMSGRELAA